MPKYHVEVPEVHYQTVEVEADSFKAAVGLVVNGDGEYLDGALEYSHTLDDCEWSVTCLNTGDEEMIDPAGTDDEED
jgi:hypothetical protein